MHDQPLVQLSPSQVLAGLNDALMAERQAAADYHAQALSCQTLQISEVLRALRDVEEEHARRLAARIVELGGTPPRHMVQPVPGGSSLSEWLVRDLRGEQWAIVEYARLIAGIVDDGATAEMMGELLEDEIRHARWLKATYLALASG